jgi:PfaB family protein
LQPIAIIGMGCLFPGADSPAAFWRNLVAGVDSCSDVTAAEIGVDPAVFYDPSRTRPVTFSYTRGGYVRGFSFDPHGLHLPSETLRGLDSLFAWALYATHQALADSGYLGSEAALARCGVALGNLSFPTRSSHRLIAPLYYNGIEAALGELLGAPARLDRLQPLADEPPAPLNATISSGPAALVTRALGLGGGYLALDAACASSLYATSLAYDALASGAADLMLAGAVSCADPLFIHTGFSLFQAYPPAGGESRPLDRASRGLTAGEGAGALVLKRLDDALRDGDRIYAVIRGVGLSNDGAGKHLLAPNPKGQQAAFERAYRAANVSPATIQYVECHATGTPVGDIVELNSMERFFTPHGDAPLVGSVKSNFGHLLTVAGVAGMIKVALSMVHGQIPPTIRVDEPLVSEGGAVGGRGLVRSLTAWPASNGPRRGAVSAFGFGGTNAHIVLEAPGSHELHEFARMRPGGWSSDNQRPAHVDAEAGGSAVSLAITGMDVCFGQQIQRLEAFDLASYAGEDTTGPLPPGRWHGLASAAREGERGAYLTGYPFDFLRAKAPPDPADQPVPQQLLLVGVADLALKDAGFVPGGNVAVLVAMETELALHQFRTRQDLTWQLPRLLERAGIALAPEEYARLEMSVKDAVHPQAQVNRYVSFIGNIMACRVASLWDFSGPAFTISAGASSVFRAVEAAQRMLASGQVDAAVVAAVDLAGGLERALLSGDASDAPADGAGAVVLRRTEDAQRAGERIYATLEGLKIGAGTAAEAARIALAQAGVQAGEIGYLELGGVESLSVERSGLGVERLGSGAATALNVERGTGALIQSDAGGETAEPTCAIGSATAIVGDAGAAAGMAGLVRAALALSGRYLPPTPRWDLPAEALEGTAFYLPDAARPWLVARGARRLAAVSALDPAGIAAYLVLADAVPGATKRNEQQLPMTQSRNHANTQSAISRRTRLRLLPLVGDDEAELLARVDRLAGEAEAGASLPDLARRCLAEWAERPAARLALALVAASREDLLRELRFARAGITAAVANGRDFETPGGSSFAPRPLGSHGKVAFVYPGAFSAFPGMGREVFTLFPQLHEGMAALVADTPAAVGERRLYPRLRHAPQKEDLDRAKAKLRGDTLGMIRTGIAFTVLYSAIVRDIFRVRPHAAFGYSMGEASMMWAMGVWRGGDDAMRMLRESPVFTRRLAGPREAARDFLGLGPDVADVWCTYIAKLPAERAAERLRGERRAFLTHINTPNEVVISGFPPDVQRIVADLGCEAFRAPFDSVLHCPPVWPEEGGLADLHRLPSVQVPGMAFYTAAEYAPAPLERDTIARNIARATCQQVDFPRLVTRVYDDGARIFLETGPANACTRWIGEILAGRPHLAVPLNRQGSDDAATILGALAKLVAHRVPLDLSPLAEPVEAPVGRTLIRSITPGGNDVPAAILSETNRTLVAKGHRTLSVERPALSVERSALSVERSALSVSQADADMASQTANIPHTLTTEPNIQHTQRSTLNAQRKHSPPAPSVQPNEEPVSHREYLRRQHEAIKAHATRLRSIADSRYPIADSGNVQPPFAQIPSHDPRPTEILSNAQRATLNVSTPDAPQPNAQRATFNAQPAIWNETELLEFAGGSIAHVFGPEYARIDEFARRVRLPMPPYLLVSRVTKLNAERGSFKPCTITTEYDIPHNAWYSVDGQAPTAVAVESGQCDLLLISYLGIDFECMGERVYRLLDCTLTFLDDLPKEGETLRYDISINSFARSGDTLLFFFSYECFVGERMVLKMDGGCAGFFSDAELADGRGVVDSREDLEQRRKAVKRSFDAPLTTDRRSFGEADIQRLIAGDLAGVFGPAYEQRGRNPSLRLPPRQILMFDRIRAVEPRGGDWGLGVIVAEKDLAPEHWYFPCHFQDDQVMAGSLMAEGCCQLIQLYMLFLGMQTHTFDARFQPIPGVPQVVRCRGQVTPTTGTLIYRLEVTEIGVAPKPFAKANVDIILNSKTVVRFRDLSVQLVEKNPALIPPHLPPPTEAKQPLYSEAQIREFATGSIAACFGPEYLIYEGRRTPRTPNGDLQLLSRVVAFEGRRGELRPGSSLVSEYDVPVNPWFCYRNSYPTAPYSVLMEMGLQPCGFLSACLGSTLTDPSQDFYFRNLDGSGHLLREADLRGKTVVNRVALVSSTALQGIILQKFTYALSVDGEEFFCGDATFGYFTPQMLANQTGLDGGKLTDSWLSQAGSIAAWDVNLRDSRFDHAAPGRVHERLAGGQLNFLDRVVIAPEGGKRGTGYVFGEKKVDPSNWFYTCHFYTDPVMPGSLGVEAMVEALQAFALRTGLTRTLQSPRFGPVEGLKTVWKYRGQIIPSAGVMTLEVYVTGVIREAGRVVVLADATLWRDRLRIYEVTQLGVAITDDYVIR